MMGTKMRAEIELLALVLFMMNKTEGVKNYWAIRITYPAIIGKVKTSSSKKTPSFSLNLV